MRGEEVGPQVSMNENAENSLQGIFMYSRFQLCLNPLCCARNIRSLHAVHEIIRMQLKSTVPKLAYYRPHFLPATADSDIPVCNGLLTCTRTGTDCAF